MLNKAELEERKAKIDAMVGGYPSAELAALETALQLKEWLVWTVRAERKPCSECPAEFPNGCVDDWETCEVEAAKARRWEAGED